MPRKSTRRKASKKEEKQSLRKEAGKKKAEAKDSGSPKPAPKNEAKGGTSPYVIAAVALVALVLGIGIAYLVMNVSSTPSEEGAKAIILLDSKCSVCNAELNQVIQYLDSQMKFSSLPQERMSVTDKGAEQIIRVLKENNVNYVPAIVFTGDITQTEFYKEFDRQTKPYGGAARFIQKVGQYYVLQPAWTTRMYDPENPGEEITVYMGADVSRDAVERLIYRILPSADLEIKANDGNYMVKFEAPENVLSVLEQVFPISTREGNTLTVPYINVEVYAPKDFLPGVAQSVQGLSSNVRITKTENLDENTKYLAKVVTDRPDLLADLLRGWERNGNVFYVMKTDKPEVELFVMSYCPYGVQTEKAIIPVLELLGDKIDFKLRFVNYAMHGEKEVWENLRQYCIQFKTDPDKFIDYLDCFTRSDDANRCMEELNIDKDAVQSCMDEEDQRWGISQILANPDQWGSQFPPFPIDDALNREYGVRGSPTLVIDGIVVPAPRNPEALKDLICSAFLHPPEECSTTLSSENEAPGFGGTASSSNTAGQCG